MSATACPRCEAVNCRCDIYAAEAMKRQEAQLAELGKIQPISQQQYQHMLKGQATQPPQPDRLKEGANSIRVRIKELRATHATELEYVQHRLRERDWHGLWDGAIGAAEWEIEITALEWALGKLGQEV